MKRTNFTSGLLVIITIASICSFGCVQKESEESAAAQQVDPTVLENEIALRLREFENHLQNGDSIALGDMYTADAVIMPSTVGREKIVRSFGSMIRDSITGSSFATTSLWGNEELLVEEGTGVWSHQNGQVVGRGKYIVVWKKEEGTWQIVRDIWFPEIKK